MLPQQAPAYTQISSNNYGTNPAGFGTPVQHQQPQPQQLLNKDSFNF